MNLLAVKHNMSLVNFVQTCDLDLCALYFDPITVYPFRLLNREGNAFWNRYMRKYIKGRDFCLCIQPNGGYINVFEWENFQPILQLQYFDDGSAEDCGEFSKSDLVSWIRGSQVDNYFMYRAELLEKLILSGIYLCGRPQMILYPGEEGIRMGKWFEGAKKFRYTPFYLKNEAVCIFLGEENWGPDYEVDYDLFCRVTEEADDLRAADEIISPEQRAFDFICNYGECE